MNYKAKKGKNKY